MHSNKLRIVITGASGQLAQCIKHLHASFNYDFHFLDRSEFDITNKESISNTLDLLKPDVIINTAAYTQVDLAETESIQAHAINHYGVLNLAAFSAEKNISLIHISTDYVFDGNASQPYTESDSTSPQTVYGKSKLEGENALKNSGVAAYWIIRTSWLYSIYGKNFFKTILKLAESRDELSVVNDQTGTPTQAMDLAEFLLQYVPHINSKNSGTYHFVNSGQGTWFDFAKEIIFKHSPRTQVQPVTSDQYPTAARRPKYSVLDNTKVQNTFEFKIRDWRDAIPN